MAKTYVEIGKFSVGSVKESKVTGTLADVMAKAAKAALGSKVESTNPKDGKGYRISGTLTKLELDGSTLKGACKLIIALLPKDEMKSMPEGKSGLPLDKGAAVQKIDAEDLAKGLITDVIEKEALPWIGKNPP